MHNRLVNQLTMARPSNTAQRRQQITAGLARLMAAKGYDGASIADVARAARLTPGLVHYHFQSKLEILLAVVVDLGEKHAEALEQALGRVHGDVEAELDAFIDVHLAVGKSSDPKQLACWIAIGAEAIRQPLVRARYQEILEFLTSRLEHIVRAGVSCGKFHSSDPRAAAVAIVAAIQGYFCIAGSARTLIPAHSAAPHVKAMARGLLMGSPESQKSNEST
jgi:TetR/AcrR family transcriptional regulator, transcriptional repressor of bet genes